jgi:hypothetical protein
LHDDYQQEESYSDDVFDDYDIPDGQRMMEDKFEITVSPRINQGNDIEESQRLR